jgi:prepilin-type processing-associated H-X9-DG protein
MAVLLPSLRSSKEQAKAVLCSSNIKQLVLGLVMYEADNRTFPYAFDDTRESPLGDDYFGNHGYDRMGWWWIEYIAAGEYKEAACWCPSRKINNAELNYVLHGNYGVNLSICKCLQGRKSRAEFIGTPLNIGKIPRPAESLLVVDSGYSMINWWQATDNPPVTLGSIMIEDTAYIPGLWINKERALWPGQEWDAIYGRHPNKTVNVGFVDGHVSRNKADDLLVEKTGDYYKNKSPLWVPK